MTSFENERQNLHTRLLDAVRACQTHLGGKLELVTEASSWISCLCTQLEAVLQHKIKPSSRGLSVSVLKQAAVGNSTEEVPFWHFVKNHLTKHEVERFETLDKICTDVGRGRAWIRCSLNEHSLDRYFHMLLSDITLLRKYYDREAFMLDEEKSSTLPQMAAGLSSIFFKIKFNDPSLDGSINRQQQTNSSGFIPNLLNASTNLLSKNEKPLNESILEAQGSDKVKKRGGRKKRAKIISFGDDDPCEEGSVTPAEKGGPGFVVINPSLAKPAASVTSESSSGIFSSDGNVNLEPKTKETSLKTHPSPSTGTHLIKHDSASVLRNVAPEPKSEVLPSEPERTGDAYSKVVEPLLLKNDPHVYNLPSQRRSSTPDHSITNSPSETSKSRRENDDDVGQVTKHLMSVRHHSAIGSHDLIMDDWSVRSSSVSGLALPTENSLGDLYPVQDDYVSQSSDSRSDLLTNTDADTSVSHVLSLTQKSSSNWQKNSSDVGILDNMNKDTMTEGELRQALVALMHRKDEIVEANRSMRTLLDSEMEHSAGLRREIEKLQLSLKRSKEESSLAQQQHMRETEVLRNQLKKYVGAVQALQRGENSVDMPADLSKISNDGEADFNETEIYEKKLIEVAEMHGELMEFNERLHVRLQSAVSLLHNMKSELVDLRGPMPHDDLIGRIEKDEVAGSADTSPPLRRALINIWMPSAFLKGKAANAHHVFQVYIRIADEEWNVYRRYSHFHELHNRLRKKYPIIDTYGFPPKKVMGNKGKKFVEDRRKGLQVYLRLLMNNIVQNHEKIVAAPNKKTLVSLLPFFSDSTNDDTASSSKSQKKQRNQPRRS